MTSTPVTASSARPGWVLLPDDRFLIRSFPVAPGSTREEVAGQALLALEGVSPFPDGQVFWSHAWEPGEGHGLLFAAYRKRFEPAELEDWKDAAWVGPTFLALLSEVRAAGTSVVIRSDSLLCILHHGSAGRIPTAVVVRRVGGDASDGAVARVVDELLSELGGTKVRVDLAGPVLAPSADAGSPVRFMADGRLFPVAVADLQAWDVRDRGELASHRSRVRRDVLLWRAFAGLGVAAALCLLSEAGMAGARVWLAARGANVSAQAPAVASIMTAHSLTARIQELSTQRLRPFEMITAVGRTKPGSVVFLRAATRGLRVLEVEAQAGAAGDIDAYRSAIAALSECESVEIPEQRTRDGVSTFTLVVTFRPGAFQEGGGA
jgi:hypothetical protein